MCHRVYSKALDENRKKISPYQKPAKLFAYLLNHHSRKSEWVLDATGGSGVGNLLLF
jgi:DNA modification methylase